MEIRHLLKVKMAVGAFCSVKRFFAVFAIYVVDVAIQKWCFITTNVSYTFISFANLENLYDIT